MMMKKDTKIMTPDEEGNFITFDGQTVPPFEPYSFGRGPHNSYADFSPAHHKWIRHWFPRLINREIAEILGVSIRTITKLRSMYDIPSNRKRMYEFVSYVKKSSLLDEKQRETMLDIMRKGREKRMARIEARRAELERKKSDELKARVEEQEKQERKRQMKEKRILRMKHVRKTLTLDEKMETTHFRHESEEEKTKREVTEKIQKRRKNKASNTVSLCIDNCWCKLHRLCFVATGNECKYDLTARK